MKLLHDLEQRSETISSLVMRDLSIIAAGVAMGLPNAGPGIVADQAVYIYKQIIQKLNKEVP